jgi:hypothetical protein
MLEQVALSSIGAIPCFTRIAEAIITNVFQNSDSKIPDHLSSFKTNMPTPAVSSHSTPITTKKHRVDTTGFLTYKTELPKELDGSDLGPYEYQQTIEALNEITKQTISNSSRRTKLLVFFLLIVPIIILLAVAASIYFAVIATANNTPATIVMALLYLAAVVLSVIGLITGIYLLKRSTAVLYANTDVEIARFLTKENTNYYPRGIKFTFKLEEVISKNVDGLSLSMIPILEVSVSARNHKFEAPTEVRIHIASPTIVSSSILTSPSVMETVLYHPQLHVASPQSPS